MFKLNSMYQLVNGEGFVLLLSSLMAISVLLNSSIISHPLDNLTIPQFQSLIFIFFRSSFIHNSQFTKYLFSCSFHGIGINGFPFFDSLMNDNNIYEEKQI